VLKELNTDQARFVALLAKAAREQRDAMLGHIADRDLDLATVARGEHNPVAALGLDPVPAQDTQLLALRDALAALTPNARSELYSLMRIGQGELAVKKWRRGIREAQSLGDATVAAALIEDPDLHEHVLKGLYEADLGS
jgi:uncharacterized protein DUF3775